MTSKRIDIGALIVLMTAILSACGSKEKPGQAIARVNGTEITVYQLDDERQRLGEQPNIDNKEVLDSLVNRQLLVTEAIRAKLDREPAVMLALERARMQVLMQAYLHKKIGKGNRPSSAEMESFYQANPDLFARRKQFDLNELVIDSKNVSPEFKEFTAKANSLDQVASWLDDKKIPYTPIEVMPTTADIPAVMIKTMNTMQKGQIFTANDSTRTLVIALRDVKDAPVSQAASMPKIEQYLLNKNIKEAGEVELARLRASAKIEYINAAFINKNQPRNQTADAAPVAAPMTGKTAASTHIDRGVAGLK